MPVILALLKTPQAILGIVVAVCLIVGAWWFYSSGKESARVDQLEESIEQGNKANEASRNYRRGGAADERLRQHDF